MNIKYFTFLHELNNICNILNAIWFNYNRMSILCFCILSALLDIQDVATSADPKTPFAMMMVMKNVDTFNKIMCLYTQWSNVRQRSLSLSRRLWSVRVKDQERNPWFITNYKTWRFTIICTCIVLQIASFISSNCSDHLCSAVNCHIGCM